MERFICIHGHFYQPPRENPWTDSVEVEDSAYPYHDWNARITAECYAPNTASRILDAKKSIVDIVNNYASISFNFGPTLLTWLEQNEPAIYAAILEADRESRKRFSGHGSAIAQVYNHIIMPLANSRDKRTQVVWGIRDFRHRFGRDSEGMWLAETAVDNETLEILADEGILFTILSPAQALRVRPIGASRWSPAGAENLDCSMPYVCRLPGGKSISLFFFDGSISQEVAFGTLLDDGGKFAGRMAGRFSQTAKGSGLLSVVSDGETYGHHHRFADMALAYALYDIQAKKTATITIFGEYLETHPPTHEVEIRENTSWSCPHGIERWRSDCGCCTRGTTVNDTDSHPRRTPDKGLPAATVPGTCDLPWRQEWRKPFREAMDRLRDDLARIYENSMGRYVADPWLARDDYILVNLDRSPASRERFFAAHASHPLTGEERRDVLRLLEMERHALLMFTSCGWFFDDISGIESIQVMKYACRAMQLAREVAGTDPEPLFLNGLSRAGSNRFGHHDGATIYLNYARRSMIDLDRIVFNYALTLLVTDSPELGTIRNYSILDESVERAHAGDLRMIAGTLTLKSEITCRRQKLEFVVLHLGNYDFLGGVRDFSGDQPSGRLRVRARAALHGRDTAALISLMEQEFGTSTFSLWHLFRDAQREILSRLMESTLTDLEASFRQIYRQNITLIHAMKETQVPVPRVLEDPAWYILNVDLTRALAEEGVDRQNIRRLVSEMIRGQFAPDRSTLGFSASKLLARLTRKMAGAPAETGAMQEIVEIFTILAPLAPDYELWECQNDYFRTGKELAARMQQDAAAGDVRAVAWTKAFRELGRWLGVRCI